MHHSWSWLHHLYEEKGLDKTIFWTPVITNSPKLYWKTHLVFHPQRLGLTRCWAMHVYELPFHAPFLIHDKEMLWRKQCSRWRGHLHFPEPTMTQAIEHITVTSWWARWCFKSPASPLFTQLFIQVQIKENIKAPRHWPLCGEFTGDRWIPRTKDRFRGKCFHLMTLSWLLRTATKGSTDMIVNPYPFTCYFFRGNKNIYLQLCHSSTRHDKGSWNPSLS